MTETPRFEGAGQGEHERKEANCSPHTALASQHQDHVDPRLTLLLSAAIRFELVERDEMSLDEAFDGKFIDAFLTATGACWCQRAIDDHFEREHRQLCEWRLRAWRWRS